MQHYTSIDIPHGCIVIASPVTGSVNAGERASTGQTLLVVKAMKMEIAIEADAAGEAVDVLYAQGSSVSAGHVLVILRPER